MPHVVLAVEHHEQGDDGKLATGRCLKTRDAPARILLYHVDEMVGIACQQGIARQFVRPASTLIGRIMREIATDDEDMNAFLFRLGCYSGEPITLVSKKKKSCVAVIKDGRYNLDNLLSEAIVVE